jgi:glycosyltransferase involved in cell wall biosynthesis
MARPTASVIVSAKNEASRIEACLDSLARQKSRIPFEVLVVDNGSSDRTVSLVKAWIAKNKKTNFHLHRQKKPGSPAARNLGAKKSLGKVLLFTDADCEFDPRWVEEMSRPLLETELEPLAALGGVTESSFQNQESPNLWERYLHQLFEFWEEDRLAAFPAFLPWAPTCNLAVRKDVFEGLGGFDENWRSAAYDVDLCWRLVLCGFILGHAPKAKLFHSRRSSLRGLLKQLENYAYFNESLLRTYRRALHLSSFEAAKERIVSKARRLHSLLGKTNNLQELALRTVDVLSTGATLSGKLKGKIFRPRASKKFLPMRQGEAPEALKKLLPAPYAHLHEEGWCYWKNPGDVDAEGDLILYNPKDGKRFRLNHSAWKIWEVKSLKGQSEDAAEKLGQNRDDEEVLRDVDEITADLRSRGLLP